MRESAINRAQGLRQSKILASEAVQIEQINKAKGEKNCASSCSSQSIFYCSQVLPCCKAGQWYCLGMRQRLLTLFPGFLGGLGTRLGLLLYTNVNSSSSLIPRFTCKSLGMRLPQLPSFKGDCFSLSKVRLLPFLPGPRPEHKHWTLWGVQLEERYMWGDSGNLRLRSVIFCSCKHNSLNKTRLQNDQSNLCLYYRACMMVQTTSLFQFQFQ